MTNRAYLRSLCEGIVFLAASSIAIFAAVTYATVHASNYVTDFVLSRVGPFNVRFLFIYGTFTAFVITASLLAWRPNRLPYALKAMALFLLVRAVFVALTHMAPSPIDPQQPAPFFNSIFYGSDLFFSGHTGLPFLAALTFWHIPQWRAFYLALTGFFGSIVLLGHYHYSIDVLARIVHHPRRVSDLVLAVRPRLRTVPLVRNQTAPRPKRASRKTLVSRQPGSRADRPFALHVVSDELNTGRSIEGRLESPERLGAISSFSVSDRIARVCIADDAIAISACPLRRQIAFRNSCDLLSSSAVHIFNLDDGTTCLLSFTRFAKSDPGSGAGHDKQALSRRQSQISEEFDSQRLADRLEDKLSRIEFTDDDKRFIESCIYFFIATADASGHPDCSFKGALPALSGSPDLRAGLSRLRRQRHVQEPRKSCGQSPCRALVHCNARQSKTIAYQRQRRIDRDDPLLAETVGAQLIVRIKVDVIFPNCPRYIPSLTLNEPSIYVPIADVAPIEPAWKSFDLFKDVVPPRR